jgi:ligand-binding sensor domain-containing protein
MIGARVAGPRAPRASGLPGTWRLFACVTLASLLGAEPAWCLWQTFGLADGLGSQQVRAIAEDRSENMWFATANGASRYDGAAFRTFKMADGLSDNDVRAIFVDNTGRIWFGTANGVSVLAGGVWSSYTTADGLASNDVRGIVQDHLGRIWFATGDRGASRFDGTSWVSYHQSDGLAADQLSCLLEDDAGAMWFGTQGGGLSRYDGVTWTTYKNGTTGGGLGNDYIECLFETRDGVLWVGTRYGGLSRFDGSVWSHITAAGSDTLSAVNGLAEDRFGLLWLAGTGGVARFDGLAWRSYTNADGLVGANPSALALDRSGNVWVATEIGVNRYDGESWTAFTTGPLGTYGAQAVLEDRSGNVWAGSAGGGIARFDRAIWTTLTAASTGGGLAGDVVSSVKQDSTGAMWFGTTAGASRFDGVAWRTFTTADGLVGNIVSALARDSSGAVWIGTTAGLSRFDGTTWRSYTTLNGLPGNRVRSLLVDRGGSLWCGTSAGVGRLQDTTWTRYTTTDGLAGANVYAILQDRSGTMWFGTPTGLSRFDGSTWRTYTQADGLGSSWVLSLAETPDSVLWVGTSGGGISRFDGALWHTYATPDGPPDNTVNAATVEHSGNLWLGTPNAATLYEPARVPPQTVIISAPPALSPNRLQTAHFVAAFRQVLGIEFSTSLDSATWSPWLPDNAWVGKELPDGVHTLRVAARDPLHHVDPTPAIATFEVAATPPAPVITVPVYREPVRDTLKIRGTANALRFRSRRVDFRPAGATSWDPPVADTLGSSPTPVVNGVLASLDTKAWPDGDYELRLAVQDTLGLTGTTTVAFIIDNVAPWAAQTTPALVSAQDGGDVYTTNKEAHLYVPPRGLARDATVHLDPLTPADVPATLPDGATRVAPGFAVSTEGVSLTKTAAFDLALGNTPLPPGKRFALYSSAAAGTWQRLGGTLDGSGTRLSTPLSDVGRYAIFAASPDAVEGGPLALTLTPRIFSSRGAIATPTVRIGFVLAREGEVRVTIHNRAGRLVRVVMSGETLGPGTNQVSWDGRDEDRRDVDSGLYFVTIEALGERKTQTLGVVR